MRGVLLILLVVLFSACETDSCRESVTPIEISMPLERLEKELFISSSSQEVETFLADHETFSQVFLDVDQYPDDSVLAKRIFRLIKEPSVDTLYREASTAFENLDQLMITLNQGLGRLQYYYPQTQVPKMQTVVTGLYKDLFISNEVIVIGLDFFIGENATYKPLDIPDYILRRYNAEHLPSIILQFMSSQYVAEGREETMLSDMINFGKNYYLLSSLLPCTAERILIGYTEEEWSDAFQNDAIIWANFIQNEWLYETNHTIKQKFLGERPNVYEIGEKCPGRIGAWLGWQIVNAYMERTNTSMRDLMAETDHNKIFSESGYKPGS